MFITLLGNLVHALQLPVLFNGIKYFTEEGGGEGASVSLKIHCLCYAMCHSPTAYPDNGHMGGLGCLCELHSNKLRTCLIQIPFFPFAMSEE